MAVSVQEAAARFASAGIERSTRYQEGTDGKGSAWAGAKSRAKANFTPAMQQALQENAYGKGLDQADASDYDRGVREKGVANWGTGMQAGAEKFRDRIQKYAGLWDQDLPTTRGPKRSAANMKRMQENVMRFVDASK